MAKIAVTGATGQLGRLVIEQLKQHAPNDEIISLVRDVEKTKAQDLGVTVRYADYSQADSWTQALDGVDKLLLISSSGVGDRVAQHRNVIQAAKTAGVQLLAYTSLLNADKQPAELADEHNLALEHIATEQILQASGVPFCILRNAPYADFYTGMIANALANKAIYGTAGNGKISAVSRLELAQAAVAVLTQTGHLGKTYELAGKQAFTMNEFAQELSRQTGQDIAYINLSDNEYRQALTQAGLPEMVVDIFVSWDIGARLGALYGESGDLERLLGRTNTPISECIAQAL